MRQFASGSGEGPPTSTWGAHRPRSRSRSGCPSTRRERRGDGLCPLRRARTQRPPHCRARSGGAPRARPVRRQAHPLRALRREKRGHSKGRWAFYPVIDGPAQRLGQQRPGGALALCVLQAGQGLLAGGLVSEQEQRRCGDGPRERRIAALGSCCAEALASGFFGALAKAPRGDASLHAGATRDVVALLQQDQAQDFPHAGHRLEQREGGGAGCCAALTICHARARRSGS
jgi:hypothetical protein